MPVRHYLRNTQAGGGTGGTVYDLSTTQGTPTTLASGTVTSTSFAEVLRFQVTLGTDLPAISIPVSVVVSAISASAQAQWRVQRLDSSNNVVASSAYATAITAAGTYTASLSLDTPWQSGDRLAISVELRRSGGGGSRSITLGVNDTASYLDPDLAAAGQDLVEAVAETLNAAEGQVTALDGRNVFVNTSADNPGRAKHPYTLWTDTEVTLAAIDPQGLGGTTFYWQVRSRSGSESAWFGPVTVNAAGSALVRVIGEGADLSETSVRTLAGSLVRVVAESLHASEGDVRVMALVRRAGESLESSETTLAALDGRSVLINAAAEDAGRQRHPYTVWTDTEVTLDAIDLQGLAGSSFHFKVRTRDGSESPWFGPVTINASAGSDLVRVIAETIQASEPGMVQAFDLLRVVGESLEATEARIARLALLRAIAEAMETGEATSTSRALIRLLAESLSAAHASHRTLALVRRATESLEASSGDARAMGLVRRAAETLSASEGAVRSLALLRVLAESAELSEGAVSRLAAAIIQVIGESISGVELTSAVLDGRNVFLNTSASESGQIRHDWLTWSDTEVALAPIDVGALGGESFFWRIRTRDGELSNWFAATIQASGALLRVISESLESSEGVIKLADLLKILADAVQVDEGDWYAAIDIARHIAETVEASESIVRRIAQALVEIIAETLEGAEQRAAILGIVRILAEQVDAGEVIVRTLALIRRTAESLQASEQERFLRALVRRLNESLEAVDSPVRAISMLRTVAEALELSEGSLSRLAAQITQVIAEALEASDATVTRVFRLIVRAISETATVGEALLRFFALARVADEAMQVSDSRVLARDLIRFADELVQAIESPVFARAMLRVLSEQMQLSESQARRVGDLVAGFLTAVVRIVPALLAAVEIKPALTADVEIKPALTGKVEIKP